MPTQTTKFKYSTTIRYINLDDPKSLPVTTYLRILSPEKTNVLTKGGPVQGYRLLIKQGKLAGTALQWSGVNYKSSSVNAGGFQPHKAGYFLSDTYRLVSGMGQGLPALSDPGAASASVADTAALTILSKRLSSELTTFQGGIFVGQIKELIHSVRHPLQALRSGLSKHLELVAKRAKRIRKLKNMRDMVANTWLETAYSIRPTLSDIDDGAKAIADFVVDPNSQEFKTLTARGYDEHATDAVITDWSMSSSSYYDVRARCFRRRSYTVKYLACIGVSPSVRSTAFQKFGLNMANFIPTLWDLIPYSFVADYFTNIGDVMNGLANLSSNVRWVMRWTIIEDLEEAKSFYNGPVSDPSHPPLQYCSGGYFSVSSKTINRGVYGGSLVPPFRWEIPGASSLKWANLAALATQLSSTRRVIQKSVVNNKLILLRKGTF